MPTPTAVTVCGGFGLCVVSKLALDASHRKTVKVETDSCCRMKDAGLSEEIIADRAGSWGQNRRDNEAFLSAVVEGAATVGNVTRAVNPKRLADIKTMKSGRWNGRTT